VLAVILAWVLALLAAMVILGFCAYELTWKLRRLRTDADKLERTVADLAAVQAELNAIQQRAAGLRTSPQTVSEG
jgi:hypothetical protein